MSVVDEQFRELQAAPEFAGARLDELPNGTALMTIPEFPLPQGWNKTAVTVYFVIPVGYPSAKPDTFWTAADLRLSSGALPQSSTPGGNLLPGVPADSLWFSWHAASWSPNRDTLITYARLISSRFQAAR